MKASLLLLEANGPLHGTELPHSAARFPPSSHGPPSRPPGLLARRALSIAPPLAAAPSRFFVLPWAWRNSTKVNDRGHTAHQVGGINKAVRFHPRVLAPGGPIGTLNASECIETDRLRLRPPVMEDAPAIFAKYATDPEVTRYLTWRPHQSIEDTRAFLDRARADRAAGTALPWVIERKEDGELVGMIGVHLEGFRAWIGYALARAHWGRGYATEAARAVVEWTFARPEIYRVWAICDVENLASARVLEKSGMQREGLLRRWSLHPNRSVEPRDSWCYSRVKS